jgi:hypothetical protein
MQKKHSEIGKKSNKKSGMRKKHFLNFLKKAFFFESNTHPTFHITKKKMASFHPKVSYCHFLQVLKLGCKFE